MAKIIVDVNGDVNTVKLDKNRYFLKIANTDTPEIVINAITKILNNLLFSEISINDSEWSTWFEFERLYNAKNSNVGIKHVSFRIKNAYKWREMMVGRLYTKSSGWNAQPVKPFNTDLIINHDCKDFRFVVSSEIEFPITKYLKYLIQQKNSKEERKVESSVQKLRGTWSWAATMNDFYEHGYSKIGLDASNYNPLEYFGTLTNGRRVIVTMRKDSVEDESPLFDIWFMKGHLGRKLNKDGMVKFVESLIDMGVLSGTKDNSTIKDNDVCGDNC